MGIFRYRPRVKHHTANAGLHPLSCSRSRRVLGHRSCILCRGRIHRISPLRSHEWLFTRRGHQVCVGGVTGELAGVAICLVCVGRTEGIHVVQLHFAHADGRNHRLSFLESAEELRLAHAVTPDEDGKVGEFLSCEVEMDLYGCLSSIFMAMVLGVMRVATRIKPTCTMAWGRQGFPYRRRHKSDKTMTVKRANQRRLCSLGNLPGC